MATEIIKVVSSTRWGAGATFPQVNIIGTGIDLSNYYTKAELISYQGAKIHYSNIVYDGKTAGSIETGATVTGWMRTGGLIRGITNAGSFVSGLLALNYGAGEEYTFSMSLIEDSLNDVTLVGDQESPGNNKVYGTDGSGVKGWYDAASGSVNINGTPVDNQVAVWTNATTIEGTTGLTFNSGTNTLTVNNIYSNAGSALNLQPGSLGSGNVTIGTAGGSNYVYLNAYSTNVSGVLQVSGNYFFSNVNGSLNGAWGTSGHNAGYNITLKGGDAYASGSGAGSFSHCFFCQHF